MNINKNNKKRSGFTLIELLTVIAIIGILAGILIPTIGLVRKNATKATAASNLRQIALGYLAFSDSGSRLRTISSGAWSAGVAQTTNMDGWARVVAEFGGLNDASLYFIDADPAVAAIATLPTSVLDLTVGSVTETAAWAANVANSSYNAAVAISPSARGSVTPLIWTKGIDTAADTTWPAASPWQGEGGHVGFLDAHVSFYKDLTNELTVPVTGAPTGSIDAAIAPGSAVTL